MAFGRFPRVDLGVRLALAAVCVALAAASALRARHGAAAAPSAPVVVARHVLPAGHVLRAGDLGVSRWPPALRPEGSAGDPATLLGRRVAGPLTTGEPILAVRLLGRDLTRGLPPAQLAVPVMLADAHAADLVHAGDRVDVLATPRQDDPASDAGSATGAASVRTVGSQLRVLAVLPGSAEAGAEIVVAADRATAAQLARASETDALAALGVPP